MRIEELTHKIRKAIKTETKEQKKQALTKAGILDQSGYLSDRLFSKETVQADKAKGQPAHS